MTPALTIPITLTVTPCVRPWGDKLRQCFRVTAAWDRGEVTTFYDDDFDMGTFSGAVREALKAAGVTISEQVWQLAEATP